MIHAKIVENIGGVFVEIGMTSLTQEYSIVDYASKKMERKCFEPYM